MPIVRGSGLLVSLATFQVPDGLTDGGFASETYVDVVGLVNIKCMASPLGTGSGFSANEKKEQEERESDQEFHIVLDDLYLAVNDVWRDGGRVVVDGIPYDLTGVEHPSQFQYTRVRACNASI
jgi:hypothetical protein